MADNNWTNLMQQHCRKIMMYTVRQKVAPFYICINFVKPLYMLIILGMQLLRWICIMQQEATTLLMQFLLHKLFNKSETSQTFDIII